MKKLIISLTVILALILAFGLTAAIAQVQPDDNMTPSDNTMAGDNWTPSDNVQPPCEEVTPPCGEVAPQPSGGCEGAPPTDNVTPPEPTPQPTDNVTPPEPTPPPTDNVTPPEPTPPPTDNVTPPTGPGTRVTITVAEPTDNVTAAEDIVDTAAADERFAALVGALQDADLVDALKGEGPFTVFAPTDEAFENLTEVDIESLDPSELANVLQYHVVSGKVMSDELADMTSVTTLSGEDLTVTVDEATNAVSVDNATVIEADIEVSNGVIHVIDAVLIPPTDNVTPPTDNVTPPTDNVTPPTDNVTPPTDNVTPPTDNVTPPTDNVTPPTDNVTPPTDNVTGQSVTLTVTEENTGDVDLIGPLGYWGQMTANDVESIVRNPDGTLTVNFADGPTISLDLTTLQVPAAVVQEWLDSLQSLVNNGNGTITLNLTDGSNITVPLPDQLSLEQGIADMLELVESIENNNDGTITINLSDGSSATISVTEIQDSTIVTMFESIVNNGDGTFTLNVADGASFTTFNMASPYVELYANDTLVDVLDYAPDSGDDGDGILNPGETWSWTVNQTIESNTTFVAIGHGLDDDTGTDITYPDYPEERAEVTVPVGSPGASGGMPTDDNATVGDDDGAAPAETEPVVGTSETSSGWLSPLWIALIALGAIAAIAVPIGIIRARSRT